MVERCLDMLVLSDVGQETEGLRSTSTDRQHQSTRLPQPTRHASGRARPPIDQWLGACDCRTSEHMVGSLLGSIGPLGGPPPHILGVERMARIDRRQVLKGAAATAVGAVLAPDPGRRGSRVDPSTVSSDGALAPAACNAPGGGRLPEGRRQPRQPELLAPATTSTAATSAGCAAPGSTASRAASRTGNEPEHGGRGRRRALHRVGARQRHRRRRRHRRDEVALPADPGHADPARRRGRRRPTSSPTVATTGVIALDQRDRRRWPGRSQILGYGNVEKVAVTYHDGLLHVRHQRRPRGAPRSRSTPTTATCCGTSGALPGRASSATTPGRASPGGRAARRRGCIRPSTPSSAWSTGPSATRAATAPRRTARRAAGRTCSPTRSSRWTCAPAQYRWHFQSIHHDIWDMDNVMAPVLADVRIRGRLRKLVVYGSKSGMYFILDRTRRHGPAGHRRAAGAAGAAAEDLADPAVPAPGRRGPSSSVVDQPLGTAVPGDPNRAVPNYVRGSLYTPHWDVPILSIPGHGGGADWNHQSFSHRTGLVYTGYGYVAAAHSLTESSNGLRPPGEYQTGGIVAVDASTNRVRVAQAHAVLAGPRQRHPHHRRATCSSSASPTATCSASTPATAASCGGSRPARRSAAARSCTKWTVEQYLAVYAGGTGIPYGNSAPRGDFLWAFKIGGSSAAGADAAAARGPPARLRRPGRGRRGRQHRRDRPHLQRRRPARSARPSRSR